jgi:nicotinamide-nucleotide adenylyltransferase
MPALPALFIGRFQPFHLGHLSAIKQVLQKNKKILIVIGSAEANFRPTNPFTCSERIQMIEAALTEAKIDQKHYSIFAVPNIQNFALWPKHIELYLPPFENIYTGSEVVTLLYKNHNQNLKKPYKIVSIQKKLNISAEKVREAILKGQKWQAMVPKSVADLLKKWKCEQRLKDIQESEK